MKILGNPQYRIDPNTDDLFMPPPCPAESTVDAAKRGRPRTSGGCKPIAPYDSDPKRAVANAFDRLTGEPVEPEQLKTYAGVLAQYHLSPEDKFENGQFLDRGRTERRHVAATGVELIGKEANHVGESGVADPVRSAVEVFTDLRDSFD